MFYKIQKQGGNTIYTVKEVNRLINKSAFVFKIMSYDCLGILCKIYLFY